MSYPILIVEDDPDGQALIAHIINHLDIPHDEVGDAEQAFESLFQSDVSYQAVIIDLSLPGKDGWELLSAIRANSETQNLTCIAVTGYHNATTRQEALKAGFDAYFSKPLDATKFAEALSALV